MHQHHSLCNNIIPSLWSKTWSLISLMIRQKKLPGHAIITTTTIPEPQPQHHCTCGSVFQLQRATTPPLYLWLCVSTTESRLRASAKALLRHWISSSWSETFFSRNEILSSNSVGSSRQSEINKCRRMHRVEVNKSKYNRTKTGYVVGMEVRANESCRLDFRQQQDPLSLLVSQGKSRS